MELDELAMRYALSFPGVDCLLTGVDNSAQLRGNLALVAKGPLPAGLAAEAAAPGAGFPGADRPPALLAQRHDRQKVTGRLRRA